MAASQGKGSEPLGWKLEEMEDGRRKEKLNQTTRSRRDRVTLLAQPPLRLMRDPVHDVSPTLTE